MVGDEPTVQGNETTNTSGLPSAGYVEAVAPDDVDEGQIVVVRPQVVENVGHVLGNLFQRLYHLIGQTQEINTTIAAQLEDSTRQLDDFLQLALDYFSPLTLALQDIGATDVAQSLARQLSDAAGCSVRIDVRLLAEGRLLADPWRLARAFGLLGAQVGTDPSSADAIELKAVARPPGRTLALRVTIPRRLVRPSSSQLEMHWTVAQKFLELHGGALERKSLPSGEVLWEIALPLQS